MSINEAIDLLRRKGIRVFRINRTQFKVRDMSGEYWENYYGSYFFRKTREFWAGRDIIKLAQSYTDSTQQTCLHRNVKQSSRSKNRPATRDAIRTGEFDKIPDKNRPVKRGNPWDWD